MNETPNSRMTLAKQPPKVLTEVLSPSLVTYKTIGARAKPKAQVPYTKLIIAPWGSS